MYAPKSVALTRQRKLLVMPGFGVRYSFLGPESDTYFVPAMRYSVSVAGTHSTRDIS